MPGAVVSEVFKDTVPVLTVRDRQSRPNMMHRMRVAEKRGWAKETSSLWESAAEGCPVGGVPRKWGGKSL